MRVVWYPLKDKQSIRPEFGVLQGESSVCAGLVRELPEKVRWVDLEKRKEGSLCQRHS